MAVAALHTLLRLGFSILGTDFTQSLWAGDSCHLDSVLIE